jgi:tRNA(Ile)-lysidine synthase
VECFTGEGDVGSVARQQRRSIEDVAREMRYQFLGFVAGKEHADCVATGHTADDQAETVLMRVIRGSGVRGIRGMLPVSPVPGSEAQRLVRPLLVLTRSETAAVCAAAGITPLTDPSNADLSLVRNRVRLETLPALRTVNPGIGHALRGLAESAREAFEGIEKAALAVQPTARGEQGSIVDLAALQRLPAEALELVIEREAAFHRLQVETNRTRRQNAASILRRGTGLVSFGEVVIEASVGLVRIGGRMQGAPHLLPVALNIPGLTGAGGLRIRVQTEPPEGVALPIDQALIRGVLRARSLQPGDRMVHHGVNRKCSDVLLQERVPRWERHGAVAITDADGVIGVLVSGRAVGGHAGDPALFVSIPG